MVYNGAHGGKDVEVAHHRVVEDVEELVRGEALDELALLFSQRRKYKNLPPGPPPLPIIGNLNLLKRLFHHFLTCTSKTHNDIFSLWFGSRLAVVISSPSAFQECFTRNDVTLANRPHSLSEKHIFYNYTTVGSCSYGENWCNLFRITSLDVLLMQRIHSFSEIQKDGLSCQLLVF
ncbi:Isoflavone 2'-hydroxylase [Glycine soja]|uniref:Isoflavone 2'-hydroxylase n=1 Tax=Glycine soja TaxID=3848 RepID=A0A445GU12_GLYSO|nr:Isoflavone 2'-hydroxylase [Glycine soja]